MTTSRGHLVRAVGFWGLVAMCINAVVGSGVFLLPSESFKLLGQFSLWAPLLFALPVFVLVLCFAEASSHFSEPGGAYLYARTAFGDVTGFEAGWMNWLARVTSLASLTNGFVVSLARLFPALGSGSLRAAVIVLSIATLTTIHLVGVRYGAASIYFFTWGKLLPLLGFIVVSLIAWRHNPLPGSLTAPGAGTDWSQASLLLLFAYAGFENMGVPASEFKDPKRDLPRALLTGTLAIALIYVLAQVGAMSALPSLGTSSTPIADAAATLIGTAGTIIITVGALLSMAGTNSGTVFEGSRMLYALSLGRTRLRWLSWVHPRWKTPVVAILIHAGVSLGLALGGTFARLAVLSAVARLTTYLVTCAALPRLRRLGGTFINPMPVVLLGLAISIALCLSLNRANLTAALLAIVAGFALRAFAGGTTERVEEAPSS